MAAPKKKHKPAVNLVETESVEVTPLTPEQEVAAVELALGDKSETKIAEEAGVDRRTVYNWRLNEVFAKRVEENKAEIRKQVLEEGIANVVTRVRRYNKRWNQLNTVFDERAEDKSHASVPGWTTGLLCHEQRSIGSGDLATVVDIYKVDVGSIKEEREIAKQAAQELGQWEEKTRHSFDLSKLTDEELEAFERISSKITPGSR